MGSARGRGVLRRRQRGGRRRIRRRGRRGRGGRGSGRDLKSKIRNLQKFYSHLRHKHLPPMSDLLVENINDIPLTVASVIGLSTIRNLGMI